MNKTGEESDRVVYDMARCMTTKLVNESRHQHFSDQLTKCSNYRER